MLDSSVEAVIEVNVDGLLVVDVIDSSEVIGVDASTVVAATDEDDSSP